MDNPPLPTNNNIGTDQPMPEKPKKQYGPLIGVIVIVLLLALGGFYLWGRALMQSDPKTKKSDAITEQLRVQSDSDEFDAIEADLEATSFDDIDVGAEEVEAAL